MKQGVAVVRKSAFFVSMTALAFAVTLAAPFSGLRPAKAEEILIGTGSVAGVYYQAGRAICRIVGKYANGLTCKPLPTAGSLYNLENVRGGAIELGIVQSDWQYYAVSKTGPFKFMDAGYGGLRALFSLHFEPFTIIARRDARIRDLNGLKGKRVNIGNPGSGQRGTMEVVMKAMGWNKNVFSLAEELPAAQQSLALCHNRIQAMVYTVGHPNASVGKATGLCDAVIVPVTGDVISKLVQEKLYYAPTEIPGGMYPGNPDPVRTFGVKATVVTSADLDAETAYKVVKSVFENLRKFRSMHPAFGGLEPKAMITEGLTAPLHDGAVRYYKEKDLM